MKYLAIELTAVKEVLSQSKIIDAELIELSISSMESDFVVIEATYLLPDW